MVFAWQSHISISERLSYIAGEVGRGESKSIIRESLPIIRKVGIQSF